MGSYADFLDNKAQSAGASGFEPLWLPDCLFDFQSHLTAWALRMGRSALLEDCGLGKTLQELVWAQNVVMKTNKRVLLKAPLAVTSQTAGEAAKFGIEVHVSRDGQLKPGINITNYERLHLFNPHDFVGSVNDESSILKNFDGERKAQITAFDRHLQYRLGATATAAPNDYIELGTLSEALGYLGYMDMLARFFKNDQNTSKPMVYRHHGQNFAKLDDAAKWRFKGHAEEQFWRWVSSWARAIRKPSDFGFEDRGFVLPPLVENSHLVEARTTAPGMLFSLPAVGLQEQREERRRTIKERCEKVGELVADTGKAALVWCHLNEEGDRLATIKDAVQVSGKDSDESKEEKFLAFSSGQIRVLVTKPKIGAWGMNWQHCAHVTSFPSHSYEQDYQGIRRCWRFGQKNPVRRDVVTTEGEKEVLKNMQRKAKAADAMFSNLVAHMSDSLSIERAASFAKDQENPQWL